MDKIPVTTSRRQALRDPDAHRVSKNHAIDKGTSRAALLRSQTGGRSPRVTLAYIYIYIYIIYIHVYIYIYVYIHIFVVDYVRFINRLRNKDAG